MPNKHLSSNKTKASYLKTAIKLMYKQKYGNRKAINDGANGSKGSFERVQVSASAHLVRAL